MILRTAVIVAMIFSFAFHIANNREGKLDSKNLLQAETSRINKETDGQETLKDVATNFLNTPYKRDPLGEREEDKIYRTDFFDCTTFVLSVVAKKHAKNNNPEQVMREINYYPPNTVSYKNRNHFTTYRNKISPYFEDVTETIGKELTKKETITLNKKINGKRLIDIDWEEEIIINYILNNDVKKIINNLPQEIGVGFVDISRFSEGLDVVHEGLLFDKKTLFHASAKEKKVVKIDFLQYLKESSHDAVLFYKIK